MSEWWTYEPADVLLFNARAYYRMLELHNAGLWPVQFLAIAAGLFLLVMVARGGTTAGRSGALLLGALWVWVAWAYLGRSYATINWAAAYVVPVFAGQGLAMAAYGLGTDRLQPAATGAARPTGIAVLAAAIVVYPLIAPALGRPWGAAEAFGIVADPTAVATLAFVALAGGGTWLMIVPALWCALSSETLWLLGSPDFFIPGGLALVLVLLRMLRPRRDSR